VPGFTVFHRDLQFVAGVRGLNANDNEKISLLLNGQNINGVMEPDFLNGPMNLDNIERVEIVVGPSSLFQQADTLAATINMITKDVQGVEAIASVGSDLPYSATLMAGKRWSPEKSVSFSFTTERKEGFSAWDPSFRPNLNGSTATGELDVPSFFSVLRGKNGDWTAQAAAYWDQRPELLIDNASPTNNGKYLDQIYTAFLSNEHAWASDLTSIFRADVSLKEQTRENADGSAPAAAVALNAEQLVYTGELGLRYNGFDGQMIQAGVQGSYDDNFNTWFTFVNPPTDNFVKSPLVERDSHAVGFYADDTVAVSDRLKFIGGARVDQNTRLPDLWFLGGRAAVIGRPLESEDWVSKLIYNRAVRFPSAVAALQTWGIDQPATSPSFAQVSPPPASPEILSTYELQQILYLGSSRIQFNVYHQELPNFITWFSPWTNMGNFHGNGGELVVEGQVNKRCTLWANASYNDSKLALFRLPFSNGVIETHHSFTNPEGNIIGSARWIANVGTDVKIMPHLTFSPAARYFTDQAGLDHEADMYVTIRNRMYFDAGLTWDHILGKDADLRLSGQNILDNRGSVASQMNGDTYRPQGADVRLTLDVRFGRTGGRSVR